MNILSSALPSSSGATHTPRVSRLATVVLIVALCLIILTQVMFAAHSYWQPAGVGPGVPGPSLSDPCTGALAPC